METKNTAGPLLQGERFLADRDYPRRLSPDECRLLEDGMLSAAQKFHLETEHWVQVEVQLDRCTRGRIFATSHEGTVSALLTA